MDDFQGQQKLLLSMGFSDTRANQEALIACGGQFQQAVAYLTNPDSRIEIAQQAMNTSSINKFTDRTIPKNKSAFKFPTLNRDQQQKVAQIQQIGFEDEGKIRQALDLNNWDVELAISMVLDDDGRLESDYSAIEDLPRRSSSLQTSSDYRNLPYSNQTPAAQYSKQIQVPQQNTKQYQGSASTDYMFPKLTQDRVQKVIRVANAGYQDEGKIRHALELSSWDTNRAISLIQNSSHTLRSDYSALNSTVTSTNNVTHEQDQYSLFRRVDPREDSVFDHPNSPM